jgi:hypothetical protein
MGMIMHFTRTAPVKRITVGISGCSHCGSTKGDLDILVASNGTEFLGMPLLKSSSCKAELSCTSCGMFIRKKNWPQQVMVLAEQERKQVKLSLWQRYGIWIQILLLIVIIEGIRRILK